MDAARGRTAVEVRVQGQWWHPEHTDHTVHGVFEWSPRDGGTLELSGELLPQEWKDNVLPDGTVQRYRDTRPQPGTQYGAIHGARGDQPFTLLNCSTLSVPFLHGTGETYERISVNSFLDGALFDDDLAVDADRLIVHLRHPTSWVRRTGLTVEDSAWDRPGDRDAPFSVVVATRLPPLDLDAPGGLRVRLFQSLAESGDHLHQLAVEQSWRLRVSAAEPTSDDALIDVASDVRDLVTIATGETSTFDRVVLQHPDLPALSLAGTPMGELREDIGYHARWLPWAEPMDPVREHDMYFSFDDFGATEGLERWLVVAERYRTELDRIMATQTSASMFLEDKMMNLAATLDSLDRMRRGTGRARINYVDRVTECVRFAGPPFVPLLGKASAEDWSKSVKDMRHDLAHHQERFRRDRTIGSHLLARQLYWLVVICLLRLSDAPAVTYESIAGHPDIRKLVEDAG